MRVADRYKKELSENHVFDLFVKFQCGHSLKQSAHECHMSMSKARNYIIRKNYIFYTLNILLLDAMSDAQDIANLDISYELYLKLKKLLDTETMRRYAYAFGYPTNSIQMLKEVTSRRMVIPYISYDEYQDIKYAVNKYHKS